jgi:hypothetical protein
LKFLTYLSGARGPRVEEPLAWTEEYPIQWQEPRLNLAELAKLRWMEGWSRRELAQYYRKSEVAIQNHFQDLKRRGFWVTGLTPKEIRTLKGLSHGDRKK